MERRVIDLIKSYSDKIPENSENVITSIGDDCAILSPGSGKLIAVTTDTLEEGVHFNSSYFSPWFLGRKAASVNLSDIAAMGARPKWAFLNLSLPPNKMKTEWVEKFIKGLFSVLEPYHTKLSGGDTVSSRKDISISVTLIGEAPQKKILKRSGASSGDLIYCSGFLGEAGGGLAILQNQIKIKGMRVGLRKISRRHLDPTARVGMGNTLACYDLATAATDISDGLATDLANICEMSSVSAVVYAEKLPVSRKLKRFCSKIHKKTIKNYCSIKDLPVHIALALSAGEDFELLWTVKPEKKDEAVKTVSKITGSKPKLLGEIKSGRGVFLNYKGQKKEITHMGYEH